jgi:hypothetical protein
MIYILLSFACNSDIVPTVKLTPDDGSFFSRPWPSDTRLLDGRPDVSNWPSRVNNPLIDSFLEEVKKLDGFGTNSPIYFQLDGEPDLSLL